MFKRPIFFLLTLTIALFTTSSFAADTGAPERYLIKVKSDNGSADKSNGPTHLAQFFNFFSQTNNKSTESSSDQRRILHRYRSFHHLFVAQLDPASVDELKRALAADLEYVERDRWITLRDHELVNLPLLDLVASRPIPAALWGLENSNSIDINIQEAWATTQGDRSMVVAVIDTGVDHQHEALQAAIWQNLREVAGNGLDDDQNGYIDDRIGWNFVNNSNDPMDDNDHGTHVAGIVAAQGGQAVGVAPGVSVMPLKFLNGRGGGHTSDALKAIDYAIANGARVINASWTLPESAALAEAMTRVESAGMLFVAAAGNSASDVEMYPLYPAAYSHNSILSVAALNSKGELASFSNYGATSVDIAAPGEGIFSTVKDNSYASLDGTSMASPFVAGVAALVWSAYPTLTSAQIKSRLLQSARTLNSLSGVVASAGMLDAAAAIRGVDRQPMRPVTPPIWRFDANRVQLFYQQSERPQRIIGRFNRDVAIFLQGTPRDLDFISEVIYRIEDTDLPPVWINSRADGFAFTFDTRLTRREHHEETGRTFTVTYTLILKNSEFVTREATFTVY